MIDLVASTPRCCTFLGLNHQRTLAANHIGSVVENGSGLKNQNIKNTNVGLVHGTRQCGANGFSGSGF
jgi:hypothetical protein